MGYSTEVEGINFEELPRLNSIMIFVDAYYRRAIYETTHNEYFDYRLLDEIVYIENLRREVAIFNLEYALFQSMI